MTLSSSSGSWTVIRKWITAALSPDWLSSVQSGDLKLFWNSLSWIISSMPPSLFSNTFYLNYILFKSSWKTVRPKQDVKHGVIISICPVWTLFTSHGIKLDQTDISLLLMFNRYPPRSRVPSSPSERFLAGRTDLQGSLWPSESHHPPSWSSPAGCPPCCSQGPSPGPAEPCTLREERGSGSVRSVLKHSGSSGRLRTERGKDLQHPDSYLKEQLKWSLSSLNANSSSLLA